jgi:hypothetical protein
MMTIQQTVTIPADRRVVFDLPDTVPIGRTNVALVFSAPEPIGAKKGAPAFGLCGRYLAGAEYQPEFPARTNVPDSIVSFYFRGKNKNNTLVLWNDKSSAKPLHVLLSGNGQIHDIVSGLGRTLSRDSIIQLDKTPLIITWQDEAEYVPPQLEL